MQLPMETGIIELDLSDIFTAEFLYPHYRNDGRALGTVMEDILDHKFENLTKKEDNDFYDMDSDCGAKIEVRVKNIIFEAGMNYGGGRGGKFPEATVHKMKEVDMWVFVQDLKNFPKVKLYCLTREDMETCDLIHQKKSKILTLNQYHEHFHPELR